MLSNSEFGSTSFLDRAREKNQKWTQPQSLAPHSSGYSTTEDKLLSMPSSGAHEVHVAPVGKGALKGSFRLKNQSFD
jgi:hypothetical protein